MILLILWKYVLSLYYKSINQYQLSTDNPLIKKYIITHYEGNKVLI